jgi:hypothetical protein
MLPDGAGCDRTSRTLSSGHPPASGRIRAAPVVNGWVRAWRKFSADAADLAIVPAMTTLTRFDPGRAALRLPRHPPSTDELIAFTLVTLWALETGRTPPAGVSPERWPAVELIAFWSDPAFDAEEPVEP